MMIYRQVFKTLEGAQKRVDFENAHCRGRYRFRIAPKHDGTFTSAGQSGFQLKRLTMAEVQREHAINLANRAFFAKVPMRARL